MSDSTGNLAACLERIARGVATRSALLMTGMPTTSSTIRLCEFVNLCEATGSSYALVGGVAAMYYGRERFWDELEFVVKSGSGFPLRLEGVRIWKDEFSDEIVSRAREVPLGTRMIRIADVNDLVAMKLRAGRLQDDYDVSEILKKSVIDEVALQSRVTPEQWGHFLDVKQRV